MQPQVYATTTTHDEQDDDEQYLVILLDRIDGPPSKAAPDWFHEGAWRQSDWRFLGIRVAD